MLCSFLLLLHLPFPSRSGDLLKCYISALLLAFLLLVIIHMSVFHAYANLASELTRFADRQFYSVSDSVQYRYSRTLRVLHLPVCSDLCVVQPISSRGHTPCRQCV